MFCHQIYIGSAPIILIVLVVRLVFLFRSEAIDVNIRESTIQELHFLSFEYRFFDCDRNPEDKKWYRGNVQSLKELDSAVVELVDYGRNVEVSFEELRQLPPEFCKTGAAAHKLVLC